MPIADDFYIPGKEASKVQENMDELWNKINSGKINSAPFQFIPRDTYNITEQLRLDALDRAIKVYHEAGHFDIDSMILCAEDFYRFLSKE